MANIFLFLRNFCSNSLLLPFFFFPQHRCVASGIRRFVASSAGNAGLAVAYIADRLGAHACIVVPTGTPELILAKIRAEHADVRQHGHDWTACDQLARQLEREEGYHYVSPFE